MNNRRRAGGAKKADAMDFFSITLDHCPRWIGTSSGANVLKPLTTLELESVTMYQPSVAKAPARQAAALAREGLARRQ